MEFKNNQDVDIAKKMLLHPLLGEQIKDQWQLVLHREFNMTDDAFLFHTSHKTNTQPLFEGKMIWQFTHTLSEPRFWIESSKGRNALIGKERDNDQILGYQKFRLAYRSIASNTNERSLICTVIPPCFTGNSLNVSESLRADEMLFCTGILNSFVVDWLLRLKVTTNINMFYIYQLPVPRLTLKDTAFASIVNRTARLICTTPEYDVLAHQVGLESHKSGIIDPIQRANLRAELDGLIAHIYNLTEQEFNYILKAFPLVSDSIKLAAQKAYHEYEGGTN